MTTRPIGSGKPLTPDELRAYLDALELAAQQGRIEIDNGDWAREELPDYRFNELIPEEHEEAVMVAMCNSGRWNRSNEGFNLQAHGERSMPDANEDA